MIPTKLFWVDLEMTGLDANKDVILEVAAGGKLTANEINRLFSDGLMRFEIRMFVLVLGLLTNNLRYALVFIAVTSTFTAFGRLNKISQKL